MVYFLDEEVRLNCNKIGGYWDKKDRGGWFCRIPQEIIKKADEYSEDLWGFVGLQLHQKPCTFLGGIHSYLNRYYNEDYFGSVNFRRLVVPANITELEVCDIPYSEKQPLLFADDVFQKTADHVEELRIKYKKEEIYDNYTPDYPVLIQKEVKSPKGLHYHINYEGDQRELFASIERNIRLAIDEQQQKHENEQIDEYSPPKKQNSKRVILGYSERNDGQKIYSPHGFSVHDSVEGNIFNAEIYPGKNAAPRISFRRKQDEFNVVIYDCVRNTKGTRKTGIIPI